MVSHATTPVAASKATSRPSMTPTNTLPPWTATPRLTTSQHAFGPTSRLTFGSNTQRFAPVFASRSWTMLQATSRTYTIADDRRRFGAAIHAEVVGPRQAQPAHRVGSDGRERAEPLFVIGAAVRQPVARFGVGCDARGVVIENGRGGRRAASAYEREHDQQD